ncbi:MAG: COG3014 family protein [Planctomycetota bacterium]
MPRREDTASGARIPKAFTMSARNLPPTWRRFGPRRAGAVLAWLGLPLAVAGCQTPFSRYQAELRGHLVQGRYDLMEEALDDPDNEIRDRKKDELLWMLDRGTVALVLDDAPTTVEILNEAEDLMDERRKRAALEALAAATISDQLTTYLGEPYEDIYVNVLKMLAHLEAGRIRGGATVEARRLATKVDLLRDEYLHLEQRLAESGSTAAEYGAAGHDIVTAPAGQFIESTLGTYLTAVTFMQTGERSNQAVAARRLEQAIAAQRHLVGPVEARAFGDLESLQRGDVNFLAVAFSGQGPYKVSQPVGPLIIHGAPVYFELPILHRQSSEVASVRLRVEGAAPRTSELDLIENLGSVAYENHRRQLPLTYMRTMTRAAAKSIAIHEAGRALSEIDNSGLAALVILGGLLLLAGTEQADLRCWTTLPGQAHVELTRLEPGSHRAHLEYLDAQGGIVHRSPPRDLNIIDGRLTTIVEAYWR